MNDRTQGPDRAECARIVQELPLFVGEDLGRDACGADRADAVREHLMACCDCRREASALQQARKALRQFGGAMPAGVDEAMFAAMHRQVLAHTVQAPVQPARPWWAALSVVAAVLLFGLGLWLVEAWRDDGVLRRPPLMLDANATSGQGLVRAVPYSGGRVELQMLGYEDAGAVGQGMAGRLDLRRLGDEARLPLRPAVRVPERDGTAPEAPPPALVPGAGPGARQHR